MRSHFWLAELLLVINFFNLSFAYFRHSTTPRAIHIGTVAGPLAWNFVALYWVGAVAFNSTHIAGRIVANVFIWGWLGYGVFFLAAYKDYTMGFALSVLAFCKCTIALSLLWMETNFTQRLVLDSSSASCLSCSCSGSSPSRLAGCSSYSRWLSACRDCWAAIRSPGDRL